MTRPGPRGPAPGGAARVAAAPPAGRGRREPHRPSHGAAGHGSPGSERAGRREPAGRAAPPGRGAPRDRFAPPYDLVQLRTPDGPLRARPDVGAPRRRPMTFAARGGDRHRGPVRRFVRAYGWRAYAIPVLTVLTALCLVDVANGATGGLPLPFGADADRQADRAAAPIPSAPPPGTGTTGSPAATPTAIYVDDPGTSARALPPAALPAGAPYAKTGGDRFDVVKGSSAASGPGPVKRYQVELEAGVAADGPAFAAAVQKTLADRRSWGGKGAMAFQRVDSGPIDFRVSLTSSLTVRKLCGYTLPFETSCYNGELGRAVINDARWVRGAVAYSGDLAAYRVYVINHEVGHALGNGHQPCRKAGTLAPVMMQQTLGLTTPGIGDCKPNPWPYP